VRGGYDNVGGRVLGHDGGGWEPSKCVGYSFGVGVPSPHAVTSVVLHGWSQVPAFDRVWCPCATGVLLFVDELFCSWWGEGCFVEIERPMHVRLCG
jgi:hypothetical protein